MELEIKNYVCRPRDSKRETWLSQRLRELPEEKRFLAIEELLKQDRKVGLKMAFRTLQQKRYFEAILEQGLQEGDASTILPWLECTVPKLGFRKVILLLNRRLESDPRSVDNALYWMSRFKPQNNPAADIVLNEIRARRRNRQENTVSLINNNREVTSVVQPRKQNAVLVSTGSGE